MTISIVILNWNGKHFLEKFLSSVIQNSGNAEIVVADNGSSDDSVEFLKSNFPSVRIILLERNLGFTGGYNAALKQINADYYVLLNSDVEVTEGWLTPVLSMMEKDRNIGAAQPKLLSWNVPDEFEYAGAAGGFIDKYGYPFCRGRLFLTLEKDKGQFNDETSIFWATGACMFVRASAFHSVNGFEELFFAHMEEIDLCWRMQASGYSVRYCGHSTVYHVGAGTLHKSNPRKTYLNFRNNLLLLYKNLDDAAFRKVYVFRCIFDALAAVSFFFGPGGWKDTKAVLRGHRDFYNMKKKIQKKAAQLSPSIQKNIYGHSVLLDYFLKGRKFFRQLKF